MDLGEKVLRIAIFDGANIEVLRQKIQELAPDRRANLERAPRSFGKNNQTELAAYMQGFDGAVVRSSTYFFDALADLPQLQFIGRAGTGVDNIRVPSASRNGVYVFNAPDSNSTAVAEQVIFQIGEYERGVGRQNVQLASGAEESVVKKQFLGRELRGKTVAVIGVGNIGSKVVSRGYGFGVYFNLFDKEPDSIVLERIRKEAAATGYVFSDESRLKFSGSIEDAIAKADYVTVHVDLNPKTVGLISAEEIGHMKNGAVLINDARETVVDEQAVLEALNSGKLGAYITDVMIKDSPLKCHPKVIHTAHTCSQAKEAQRDANRMIGESIATYLRSEGKEIIRAYNYPTIEGPLRNAYNLARIVSAFASRHALYEGHSIDKVALTASGLSAYNDFAMKTAIAAGVAYAHGKLNGNNDLPAMSILEELEIELSSVESGKVSPGTSPRILLELSLRGGSRRTYNGMIDNIPNQPVSFSLQSIDGFSGRGVDLRPIQYLLVEHADEEGALHRITGPIAAGCFNIERDQIIFGMPDGRNVFIAPVRNRTLSSISLPESVIKGINDSLSDSRISVVDLRQYHSPYSL